MRNIDVKAIELVIFEPEAELSEQEIRTLLESLNSVLSSYNGFVSRQLAVNEDGQWMDLVFWETLEDAKAAADNIMEQEIAKKAFSVINEQTIKFYHFNPISRYPSRHE